MVTNQTTLDPRAMTMRRPLLITLVALGSLVCLIGSTGLFAALTDSALTGTNQVDSAGLPNSADIQLAAATREGEVTTCGSFAENLSTGLLSATDVVPGDQSGAAHFCIRNVGSQPVTITASAIELVDSDTDCTGDEDIGDETCGLDELGQAQAGELSTVLTLSYYSQDCDADFPWFQGGMTLNAAPVTFFDTIAAGSTVCYSVDVAYFEGWEAADVQKAQSDRATWRIQFTAQA